MAMICAGLMGILCSRVVFISEKHIAGNRCNFSLIWYNGKSTMGLDEQ